MLGMLGKKSQRDFSPTVGTGEGIQRVASPRLVALGMGEAEVLVALGFLVGRAERWCGWTGHN